MSVRSIPLEQEPIVVAEYLSGATCEELADRYRCSHVGIRSALRRQGVRLRTKAETHRQRQAWTPEVEDELLGLYREGWSVKRLAKHMSVRDTVISELLRRRAEPLHPGGRSHPKLRSPAECQQVADQHAAGKGLRELAAEFGVSTPTIAAALERIGVEPRRGRPQYWTPERLQWLADQYHAGRSQRDIGTELGLSQTAISSRLRELGVMPPSKRPTGPDSPTWNGGRTVRDDGYVWVRPMTDDLVYCTAYRGGYVPEHRLVMARALGRPLLRSETVHHINGVRDDNRLENLQLRQGKHGSGVAMRCLDCGSHNIEATKIAT